MSNKQLPLLTKADKKRLKSNRQRVADLMSDGKWHTATEICDPFIGGREGLRRLRELRKDGCIVDKRRKTRGVSASAHYTVLGTWEYRVTGLNLDRVLAARPEPTDAEMARLRAELRERNDRTDWTETDTPEARRDEWFALGCPDDYDWGE